MAAEQLPTQFPALVTREVEDFAELNRTLRTIVRSVEDLRRILVRVVNDHAALLDATVNLTGNQTIAGAKTFQDTMEVFDIFAGARFRQSSRPTTQAQPSTDNSDEWITTEAGITIPNTANGWRAWFVLGGDHDFSFNSLTLDISALASPWSAGNIIFTVVTSSSTIFMIRFPGGDIVTESSFA